jgi:uncharacterized protein (TIGR01777 family)
MQIAITGATGMVGHALTALLRAAGHGIVPVSRRPIPGGVAWDPARGEIDAFGLEGMDAVVHLAGENLAAGRWTASAKRRIWESRTRGTRLLSETLAALAQPPATLVSVSAMGYYGARHGDEWLDETLPAGDDFLAKLCVAWEEAADPARASGIRVVHPRIGLILSADGGALARMLPPFRLGLGGPLGSGDQWMSWIAIDDLVAGLFHAITNGGMSGPVNYVTANPVRNAEFTRTLAATLHRPAFLSAPAPLLRLALGEMADLTLLASLRVSPARLIESGFDFRYPELGGALANLLSPRA